MQHVSSGGLKLKGSFLTCYSVRKHIKYSIGDFVFVKEKALKGIIERVCIKKYFIISEYKYDIFKYQDTFNRIWFENEIIPHQEAVNLAIAFYENKLADM